MYTVYRNDYEWDVGRFRQAERPRFTKFREFPRLVEEVVDRVRGQEERPVMMYCTGGIRCEVYTLITLLNLILSILLSYWFISYILSSHLTTLS